MDLKWHSFAKKNLFIFLLLCATYCKIHVVISADVREGEGGCPITFQRQANKIDVVFQVAQGILASSSRKVSYCFFTSL